MIPFAFGGDSGLLLTQLIIVITSSAFAFVVGLFIIHEADDPDSSDTQKARVQQTKLGFNLVYLAIFNFLGGWFIWFLYAAFFAFWAVRTLIKGRKRLIEK